MFGDRPKKKGFESFMPKSISDIVLGLEIRHLVTDLKGTITSMRERLSGQKQFMIEPRGDGTTIPDAIYTDWQTIEVIGNGLKHLVTPADTTVEVKLGQTVKHKITGFVGIAVERLTYMNGCVFFQVDPTEEYIKTLDKNFPIKSQLFDHQFLEIIDEDPIVLPVAPKHTAEETLKPTGGPSRRVNNAVRSGSRAL